MFRQITKQTKEEIILKIKNGETVAQVSNQYGISPKTIYGWLKIQVKPESSLIEMNRLKRENEELKRIIGLITLEIERGKKIEIIKKSKNKKLISRLISVNNKNIYCKSKKELKDLKIKNVSYKI